MTVGGARYGYENLLAAQIHLDEGTPHAHIWIAPVIRGEDGHDRLCAKERLDGLRWQLRTSPESSRRECADDDKGAQTRFGGLGEGHGSRDAGERSAGCCKGIQRPSRECLAAGGGCVEPRPRCTAEDVSRAG